MTDEEVAGIQNLRGVYPLLPSVDEDCPWMALPTEAVQPCTQDP